MEATISHAIEKESITVVEFKKRRTCDGLNQEIQLGLNHEVILDGNEDMNTEQMSPNNLTDSKNGQVAGAQVGTRLVL